MHSIDYPTLEAKLADWDIMRPTCTEEAQQMYKAAPGHIISPEPWTHTTLFDSLDRDRANGAIHDINHPEIHEGGLAVLRGNLAPTAAWSRPPVFRRRSGSSVDRLWWSTPRSRPSRSF